MQTIIFCTTIGTRAYLQNVQNYYQKKPLSWKQNQFQNFNDQYVNFKRNQNHNFELKQRSNLKQKKYQNFNKPNFGDGQKEKETESVDVLISFQEKCSIPAYVQTTRN